MDNKYFNEECEYCKTLEAFLESKGLTEEYKAFADAEMPKAKKKIGVAVQIGNGELPSEMMEAIEK